MSTLRLTSPITENRYLNECLFGSSDHKLWRQASEHFGAFYGIRKLVRNLTSESKLPFSWLSTRSVCQRWSAHFAAYPTGVTPCAT